MKLLSIRPVRFLIPSLTFLSLTLFGLRAQAAEPRLSNDKIQLKLVAHDPDIVTPVAMAFDKAGRLLVVESHTHQRPANYQGPKTDRIRMFADSDGDGKLDRWTTFAEGFRFAVGVLPRPDGAVYVIGRQMISLVKDTDGDGKADERHDLIHLKSEDEYPHNGLEGIALAPDGSLLFGLGENHGMAYTLTGSDGSQLHGKGGIDGIFRATPEGGKLEHYAGGCWNPFSFCFDDRGRLFAADNDPDSSPPCRLLHIVPGGDYGFLFQYGRAGTHPLQSWNGELPGSLPMVCGIGEAPTAIVAHGGRLWVTSWGDHRLEAYRLVPKGASFTAQREVVVQGDTNFRPTGLAVAPDGSLYLGDWMLRDYPVHGRGRIWRLNYPEELWQDFPRLSAEEQQAAALSDATLKTALRSNDVFLQAAGIAKLAQRDDLAQEIAKHATNPRVRLAQLVALRRQAKKPDELILRAALADKSPDVRLYAVRWIADERITALRDDVSKLLDGPLPTQRYYLAVLGAIDWLNREFDPATTKGVSEALMVRELQNPKRSPAVHALALGLIPPDNKYLTLDRLRGYLKQEYEPLRLEAVRTLTQQSNPKRFEALAAIARDANQSDDVRAEAIAGLAAAADQHRDVLDESVGGANPVLAREAARVLRLAGLTPADKGQPPAADSNQPTADAKPPAAQVKPPAAEAKPLAADLVAWERILEKPGDAAAGRRLFFSALGGRCAVCHQFAGRGGSIGPDLTAIGRNNPRKQIIASILQPSREIAPHYQSWVLVTTDGKMRSGLRLAKAGDDGIESYADSQGQEFTLKSSQIETCAESSATSIMPDGLQTTISIDDLRDLVTFLTSDSGATSAAK